MGLGDAKRGEAVEHGGTNLKLGDLAIELPCHNSVAQ